MKIETTRIPQVFNGERCYVHARGVILDNGFGIITTQKLELSGCDVFYGIEMMKTYDGGKTFSKPAYCKNLKRRYLEDGTSVVMCDATPFYHRKTGKIILTGHLASYGPENVLIRDNPPPRQPVYAVYDENTGDFSEFKRIYMPKTKEDKYYSAGAGCSQILETSNGELLIPIYYNNLEGAKNPWQVFEKITVLRCEFNGEEMTLKEIGNELSVDVPRGLGEPSIIKVKNKYLLAIRNDQTGYVANSGDGLHFENLKPLCFDNGENAGNYNTQQHWLLSKDKAYMVYTRRAGINDHVFRHRAPLFIAEFDDGNMCIIKDTERVAVIERGARLGNFGCQSYSDKIGYVFASEWMQKDGINACEWKECAKYGSDNSLFISKIIFD